MKNIILICFIVFSCTPSEEKITSNEVLGNYNSNYEIYKSEFASNLKQVIQYKKMYRNDSVTQKSMRNFEDRIKLSNSYKKGQYDSTKSFIFEAWKKNIKILNDSSLKLYEFHYSSGDEIVSNYWYYEVENKNYSTYYLLDSGVDTFVIESAPKGYLKDIYYLSEQIKYQKIDLKSHFSSPRSGNYTCTMFNKNFVTSNIIISHSKQQVDKIENGFLKIDSILCKNFPSNITCH